jgi:tetratricopeptide (TPR) repeat protein
LFESAVLLYHNNELEEAVKSFEKIIEINPDDKPAQKFIDDIKTQLSNSNSLLNPLQPGILKSFKG